MKDGLPPPVSWIDACLGRATFDGRCSATMRTE